MLRSLINLTWNTNSQIVPLISQSSRTFPVGTSNEVFAELTTRIQFGGDEVVKAKDGAGSATLSMAYAGAEFAAKLLRAIQGEQGIIAPTYVNLTADPEGGKAIQEELKSDISYFSARVEISANGVEKIHPLGKVSEFESQKLAEAVPELKDSINKASLVQTRMRLIRTLTGFLLYLIGH